MKIRIAISIITMIAVLAGFTKSQPSDSQVDTQLSTILDDIRNGPAPQDTYVPLYTLMLKKDGNNRHSPEEIFPVVRAMFRWVFRKDELRGLMQESPMPRSKIEAYSQAPILVYFDKSGAGWDTWSLAECYELSNDKFRKPTEEEAKIAASMSMGEFSKRGYAISSVHHRIRGQVAYIQLGLDALDLKMVWEKDRTGWKVLYPYMVFWGTRER